jgi:hypothetical protein
MFEVKLTSNLELLLLVIGCSTCIRDITFMFVVPFSFKKCEHIVFRFREHFMLDHAVLQFDETNFMNRRSLIQLET